MTRTTDTRQTRWAAWLGAAALLTASFATSAALSLQVRPDAEVVAVAFPPWWGSQRAFLATATADAAVVRQTALGFLLVVRPNRDEGLARLREAGGWLVLDPRAASACLLP